jgi:hypothetical protein
MARQYKLKYRYSWWQGEVKHQEHIAEAHAILGSLGDSMTPGQPPNVKMPTDLLQYPQPDGDWIVVHYLAESDAEANEFATAILCCRLQCNCKIPLHEADTSDGGDLDSELFVMGWAPVVGHGWVLVDPD